MAQMLKVGALLDHGKYEVLKVLGQGGFGITYLVRDLGLDKLRAVKEFFPKDYCERDESTSQVSLGTSNTAEFVDRLKAKFIKEARNIANLDQHQGIIKIHTVFEENNTAYYVMDYIEGESLSAMVKRLGALPKNQALKYIDMVGEALEYVHRHHINHLDIKPANIMIRRKDDRAILIDFGLAKQYDSEGMQTSTTPTGISHGYAPIEQYKDGGVREFSPQTDLYSLAATLYYVLTATVPPHATDLIESDLKFPAGFPESLVEPLRKALSTRRQSRQESIGQFLAEINGRDEETVIVGDEKTVVDDGGDDGGDDKDVIDVVPDRPDRPDRTANLWKYIVAIILACVAALIIIFIVRDSKAREEAEFKENIEGIVSPYQEVTDLSIQTSLGPAIFSGTINEEGKPDGWGVAYFDTGYGKKYDGQWVNGVMEGECKYYLRNGDVFEGTFKNDKFDYGKYINNKDNEYFIGSFKDKKPDVGKWYDKNGKLLNEN